MIKNTTHLNELINQTNKIAYNSLNSYLRRTFGHKVYKVAIDGGFTCPNRDGKISYGGCTFCSEHGSGEFAQSRNISIKEQIEKGIEKVQGKMPIGASRSGSFIAYFQNFTNTYAPVQELREKYMQAIEMDEICALSIATRPDCLGDDVLDLLSELNQIKPVWVELGLQTIHEQTAVRINRGYNLPVYNQAVKNLKERGIEVITHVILGLPGETVDDMLATVKYVGDIGSNGIKLQLLHVIKGTQLERKYSEGKFKCLSMDEYIDLICKCLLVLPDDIIVHRLTGDGDKKTLVAPQWSANKKQVLNEMNKYIMAR